MKKRGIVFSLLIFLCILTVSIKIKQQSVNNIFDDKLPSKCGNSTLISSADYLHGLRK